MKLSVNISPQNFLWLVVIIIFCFVFFRPFFIQGKIPIPADTIVGMYHPWRDAVWDGLTAGVPFKNPLITDPVRQQFIWKKLAIDQFKQGHWPLWNPYTHAGMPLLANFQTGALYPLNLIFFVFGFDFSWGIYIVFQSVLAMVFMYLFLRELKLGVPAGLFGAAVFAFCGFNIAWLEWGNIGNTILWLPLILLSIEKIVNQKSKGWLLVFVLSLCSSFFAGHLQVVSYVIIFSMVYALFKAFSYKEAKKRLPFLLLVTGCLLVVALITAVQWLPTAELIGRSAREIDQVSVLQRNDWFLPFQNLVQLVVPDFFGNPATGNYWGIWNYGEFVSFIGIVPLFFASYSVWFLKKSKVVVFFLLSCVFFLSLALPTPWAKLPFLLKIPFVSSAQPSRIISLVDFCLSILAAYGFDYFYKSKKDNKKTFVILGFLAALILGLWFFVFNAPFFFPQADWLVNLAIAKRNLIFPSMVFAGMSILLVIWIFLSPGKKIHRLVVIGILILLAVLDLFRFGWKFTPFSPPEWIFPSTQTINYLKRDESLFRIMSVDRSLMPANFAADYKLQTVSGYDPLYLKNYARLITELESGRKGEIASFNRIVEPANFGSQLADELNVKYVMSLKDIRSVNLSKVYQEGQTRLYFNEAFQSRFRLISGSRSDPVLIEYLPWSVKLKLNSKTNDRLVMADIYYPGWQAKLNSVPVDIKESKNGLREIPVTQGENDIEITYNPIVFKIGLVLSISGLAVMLFFWLLGKNLLKF